MKHKKMRQHLALKASVMAVMLGLGMSQASANTMMVDVTQDGYFLQQFNNWYGVIPGQSFPEASKTYASINEGPSGMADLSTWAYYKYNIASLVAAGVSAADVISATMNFALVNKIGMSGNPLQLGNTANPVEIGAYTVAPDFSAFMGTRGWVDTGNLNQYGQPIYDSQYTVSTSITSTVNVGDFSGDPVDGDGDGIWDTQAVAIDITDIVRGWLNGTANHGLEMFYANYNQDDVLYLSTMETDTAAYGNVTPYLEVTVVPVPAAVWLFGSGLLGLVAIARRRRT